MNKHLSDLILKTALLITLLCVFVPFSPTIPGLNPDLLDQSWAFAMNQAIAQGLSIGQKLVFTFGPYASVFTQMYHPSTDWLMMTGSIYLGVSYWLSIIFLVKDSKRRWAWAFLAVLAGITLSRDTLLFSYPLLVGLSSFKILQMNKKDSSIPTKYIFFVLLLFAPFGLLPLIKGSALMLCGAIVAICTIFISSHKTSGLALALTSLITPIVLMPLFWIASGQHFFVLPDYFINMIPIVSGYTEAMASDGHNVEIFIYLIPSSILFAAIFSQPHISAKQKNFLFSVFFIFLFISFKEGFVRHDGHAMVAADAILIASLLLPMIIESKLIPTLILTSILAWSAIDMRYTETSTSTFWHNFRSTYSTAWHGFKHRMVDKKWPGSEFDASLLSLKNAATFPKLSGTTDIYSYNQSYLFASGNTWNPRPVFQSYSVYTPSLAYLNKSHLLGDHPPDNVIFNVEPIDGRIPSLEDGASWPVLLTHYQPTELRNGFCYLLKKTSPPKGPIESSISQANYSFGSVVPVPNDSAPIFAEISIHLNVFGKLDGILYKPSQLKIVLNLENGTTKTYRISSGMVKSGFLISPLVENTRDFTFLYGKTGYLNDKKVKSFSIEPVGSKWEWERIYKVVFKRLNAPEKSL